MRHVIRIFATLLATAVLHGQLVSPNLERGFDPQKAYAVEEVGIVNLFNGNLNVTVPIGITYPVSSTLSYALTLQYGGNNWEYQSQEDFLRDDDGEPLPCDLQEDGTCRMQVVTYGWAYPTSLDNAGFGWRLHLGRLSPETVPIGALAAYESPDGGVHVFYPTLHHGSAEPVIPNVFYTRDGSYLRMKVDGTDVTIESPDGTIRTFRMAFGHPSLGRVVEIADRHGNSVTVDYDYAGAPTPGVAGPYTAWRIHDSTGRNHYLYFKPTAAYHETGAWSAVPHESLAEARLQMPGQTAVWTFHYAGEEGAPPPWAILRRPGFEGVFMYHHLGEYVQTALLQRVVPPAGGSYTFTYDVDGAETLGQESSGILKSVTLPTLGSVQWTYELHHYPAASRGLINHKNPPAMAKSVAVKTRTVKDASGVVTAHRRYAAIADPVFPDAQQNPPLEKKVTVMDYTGTDESTILRKTVSFFSLCSRVCLGRALQGEYGLPLTRKDQATGPSKTDAAGRSLSTITYGRDGDWNEPLQYTYVAYQADVDLAISEHGWFDLNRRVFSQRTAHRLRSGAEVWTDSLSTNFDGLGHYRVTDISSSAALGAIARRTTKHYNPNGGVPSSSSVWFLEGFDYSEVTDGAGTTARTEFCFDAAGLLTRTRTWRGTAAGPADLLAVFTNAGGNVQREEYHGGDDQQLYAPSSSFVTCSSTPAMGPRYAWTYSYAHGVRSATQYDGVTFRSVDLGIDPAGLPTSSVDTSGIATYFKYDALGRIEEIRPCPLTANQKLSPCNKTAWTQYQYTGATASAPASVTARQWSEAASVAELLTETHYYYDHLGRLIQQRNWLSGVGTSNRSVVATRYDALGRTAATTVAMGATTGSYAPLVNPPETVMTYDALGRVMQTTLPDGTWTDADYGEAPVAITRSVSIRTSDTGEARVLTREAFDGLGRLTSVQENAGPGGVTTHYAYDEGDRLELVTAGVQSRRFHYDSAGLLMWEQHPEIGPDGNGQISYSYDARRHAVQKTTPPSTLTMIYDSAERLLTVTDDRLLQRFTYDGTSDAHGKLSTATRHNYLPADLGGQDIIVTEAHRYLDSRGRLSSKQTTLSTGETFSESYEYDLLGALRQAHYPMCVNGCSGLAAPPRTVTNDYARGYLRSVPGYTRNMLYHPSGLLSTLQRVNANGSDGPRYEQKLATHQMPRPSQLVLSGDCTNLAITTQPEPATVAAGSPANITVAASGATSIDWFVVGTSTPVQTSAAQMATLTVPVNTSTTYFARAGNGACTVDSRQVTVSVCTPPDATISVPATINPNGEAEATVAGTGTYAWTIENGTILSAANTKTIRFRASCSGTVVLRVTVSASCAGNGIRHIGVVTPSVTVTATPNPVVAGAGTSLTVAVAGAGPWTVTWGDSTTSAMTRSVIPRSTGTYAVTAVNGCTGSWGSVTVQVTPPPAPFNLHAVRSGGRILLSWSLPAGADIDSYVIYRCDTACRDIVGTEIDTSSTTADEDQPPPNRAYVYRVRARKLDTMSAPSGPDFTSTVILTDHPVVPGVTPARVTQLVQMRAAVDALRLAAGLGAAIYTDAPQSLMRVSTRQISELREALNAARLMLSHAAISYTDPELRPGVTRIRAVHFNEIMGGVQ